MLEAEKIENPVAGRVGRVTLLRLKGAIDAAGARALIEMCKPLLGTSSRVVLNVRDVAFISSSGIGALLTLTEDFRERHGAVHICDMSTAVRIAIELLNLDGYLDIHATEEEGLGKAAA